MESQLAFLSKGGVLMYPILLLSVLSLAVFLERVFSLRKEKYVPKGFIYSLGQLLKEGKTADALELSKNDKSPVARITADVLSNLDLPISRLIETAEESGRYHSKGLEKFIPTLQAIGSISPLLGLLGTVIGMIKTFISIGDAGLGNAQALAGGISEALLTTAAGLSVAIPTMIFYYIVKARSKSITMEMEKAVSKIININFKEG